MLMFSVLPTENERGRNYPLHAGLACNLAATSVLGSVCYCNIVPSKASFPLIMSPVLMC